MYMGCAHPQTTVKATDASRFHPAVKFTRLPIRDRQIFSNLRIYFYEYVKNPTLLIYPIPVEG